MPVDWSLEVKINENRKVNRFTNNNRPRMEWVDDKTLQTVLDILWNAEGVSMEDWRNCSNAIEGYYGSNIDQQATIEGKSLVIENLESDLELLEQENLVLHVKYTEARDEIINNGGDTNSFEEVGELVKNYFLEIKERKK